MELIPSVVGLGGPLDLLLILLAFTFIRPTILFFVSLLNSIPSPIAGLSTPVGWVVIDSLPWPLSNKGCGNLSSSYHGQLGISLVFLPFDVQGGILVSNKAAYVGSTDQNRYCPLFPDFPPWTPQSAAQWSDAICVREQVLWGECQKC
jgi:hypothetical protein